MGSVTEKRKVKRKVVYIPEYLWKLLHDDAVYQRETVTYALKQVLLSYYPEQRVLMARGNNKNSDPSAISTTQTQPEEEEEF